MDLDDIAEMVVVGLAFLFVITAIALPWVVVIHFVIKYW